MTRQTDAESKAFHERERCREIESITRVHKLGFEFSKHHIESGTDIALVRGYALELIPAGRPLSTMPFNLGLTAKERGAFSFRRQRRQMPGGVARGGAHPAHGLREIGVGYGRL